MTVQVVRAHEHRRMPWANGGGWTTEIVALPNAERWQWRVSVADIEADGPFSVLEGVRRTIALVAGAGCVLDVEGRGPQVMDRPYVPFDFDGGAATGCRLLDGPVQDLNLMQRGAPERSLRFVHLAGKAGRVDLGEVAIVVHGHVRLDGGEVLDRLDAVRDGGTPAVAAANGAAVLAVIGPIDAGTDSSR